MKKWWRYTETFVEYGMSVFGNEHLSAQWSFWRMEQKVLSTLFLVLFEPLEKYPSVFSFQIVPRVGFHPSSLFIEVQ